MRLIKQPLALFPLVWCLLSATIFLWISSFAPLREFPWAFLASIALSYGFWVLFCGLSAFGYRRTKWTLVISLPLFLAMTFFQALQVAHYFLFGKYVTMARFDMIRLNWDIIVGEVVSYFDKISWSVPIGIVFCLSLTFYLFNRFSRPIFSPMKWRGVTNLTFAFLWLAWIIFIFPNKSVFGGLTPDLAAQFLQRDFVRVMKVDGSFLNSDDQASRPAWLIDRQGTQDVPNLAFNSKSPNIIVVLLESIRTDHTSVFGYHRDTTPFLAKLAQKPEVYAFPYTFANATVSYLSMISLTSGYGMKRSTEEFQNAPLMWDYLKKGGYETFLVTQSIGYPRYLLDKFLQTPGLDFYADIGQASFKKFREKRQGSSYDNFLRRFLKHFYEETKVPRDDAWSLDVFVDAIKGRDQQKPFFGLWELECTHIPYCYGDEFGKFQPAKSFLLTRERIGSLKNDYDNAILYSDHMIQLLFQALETQGILDNTVVVIASDHGEAFFDHDLLFHGGNLYQEQSRVPFMIYVPPRLAARYSQASLKALEENQERPVQLVDLLPTILGIAKGKGASAVFPNLDGRSLLHPLPEGREIYLSNAPPFPGRMNEEPRFSTVNGRLEQYIEYGDGRPAERYDLKTDPKQENNLAD